MADDRTLSIEQDLNNSLEELRVALQRASDVTAALQRIVPRVSQIGSLFDELASVINSGRKQLGITGEPGAYTRPTLVTRTPSPIVPDLSPGDDPWSSLAQTMGAETKPTHATLTCFRLEFESKPGPLDLRSVDDAVGEHPSVRDVALLDYDGRKATLKVWIEQGADPAAIRDSLTEKAATLFGTDNEVTVTAHEEAA
jgi:hypothetical protein